jgi:hypothetical protein
MYVCNLDHEGNKRLHRNVRAKPHDFLPSRAFATMVYLVVGVEHMSPDTGWLMFAWKKASGSFWAMPCP